jgi:hypothetical protein
MEKEIYELFKVFKIDTDQLLDKPNLDLIRYGLVLDFVPTKEQTIILQQLNESIDVNTMFSHEDRMNSDPIDLIISQVLHYIEIYGFGEPGVFSQLSHEGSILPVKIVRGVSEAQLHDMIRKIMYSNVPIKDVNTFEKIVRSENPVFNVNKVANNELRVRLYAVNQGHWFESGDDAVRWIVLQSTGETNLIKSPEVINKVSATSSNVPTEFLEAHATVLSQVFNRHKRIIVALKGTKSVNTVINRISRMSKKTHVPIREAINKTYIAKALSNEITPNALRSVSVRDKFKFLNVLSWKKQQKSFDAYIIRNGKIHLDKTRKVFELSDIARVEKDVLESLRTDLQGLYYKQVLLDANVDYGLPTSRKQTVGNLPFGTRVSIGDNERISAGVYWENSWGARDLDLSTVDMNGNRTGWGSYSGYEKNRDVIFSGDVTNAPEGAMEFMTSSKTDYGLFVNIYSGNTPCDMEVVVGTEGKEKWIENVLIREKYTLQSRGEIVGFVQGSEFVVYAGRLNNKVANFGNNPVVQKSTVDIWTVKRLLNALDIPFLTVRTDNLQRDYDLSYENFSFDKLESLFE